MVWFVLFFHVFPSCLLEIIFLPMRCHLSKTKYWLMLPDDLRDYFIYWLPYEFRECLPRALPPVRDCLCDTLCSRLLVLLWANLCYLVAARRLCWWDRPQWASTLNYGRDWIDLNCIENQRLKQVFKTASSDAGYRCVLLPRCSTISWRHQWTTVSFCFNGDSFLKSDLALQ